MDGAIYEMNGHTLCHSDPRKFAKRRRDGKPQMIDGRDIWTIGPGRPDAIKATMFGARGLDMTKESDKKLNYMQAKSGCVKCLGRSRKSGESQSFFLGGPKVFGMDVLKVKDDAGD